MEEENAILGLWWIWPLSALVYHILDSLLRRWLVPWFVKRYCQSKQRIERVLPGYLEALITEKVLITLTAVLISVTGAVIVYQTSSDVLQSKSSLVLPAMYVLICSVVHDFYRMFETFKLSNTKHVSLSNFSITYKMAYVKFSFVAHHVLLSIFGLIFVHHSMRKGLGDFLIGCAYIMESTNPFICMHFVLKELQLKDGLLYVINGIFSILVHFVTRIAMFPFMYWIYAYQYHNGDIVSAVYGMRAVCHIFLGLGFAFQAYWFGKMLKMMAQTISIRLKTKL